MLIISTIKKELDLYLCVMDEKPILVVLVDILSMTPRNVLKDSGTFDFEFIILRSVLELKKYDTLHYVSEGQTLTL